MDSAENTPVPDQPAPVEAAPAPPTPDTPAPEPASGDLAPLPEDGTADLHTVKERNRELASLRAKLREQEATIEEGRKAALTEQEKAIEDARSTGYSEAETLYKGKLLKARVERLAVGAFAEPGDVTKFLELDEVPEDATDEALTEMLNKLLEDKEYLAANDREPKPRIPQAPRSGPAKENDDWLGGLIRRP